LIMLAWWSLVNCSPIHHYGWRGLSPAMPMFRDFNSWRERGCWRIWWLQTEIGVCKNSPRFAHQRVKTSILLVWSCIAGIFEAVTMVHRWNLAEVEEDGVS
jgi:hypothetical protein